MATKILTDVSFWMTSANTELQEDKMFVRYCVTDGDLSKHGQWTASGLDLSQPISGIWNAALDAIKALENIE